MAHEDVVSPIVAAVPLIAITSLALWAALRFRARAALRSDFRSLPTRALGRWRVPALLVPVTYLTCGVGVPIFVMLRWAMGSTQTREPMSVDILRRSFRAAVEQSGDDLSYTLLLALLTTGILLAVSIPAARAAARRFPAIEHVAVLPVAVPAVLLAIGFVKVFNSPVAGSVYDAVGYDVYDSMGVVGCAYAARFLPFGILTLSQAVRRLPRTAEEAAMLTGRGALACGLRIHLPALLPAIWSVACLAFVLAARELDVAVVLPAGNDTVVRRLSNIVHFGGEDAGGALALMLLVAVTSLPILTVLLTGRKLRPLS